MVSVGSHMVQTDSSSYGKGVVFIVVGSKQLHKIQSCLQSQVQAAISELSDC